MVADACDSLAVLSLHLILSIFSEIVGRGLNHVTGTVQSLGLFTSRCKNWKLVKSQTETCRLSRALNFRASYIIQRLKLFTDNLFQTTTDNGCTHSFSLNPEDATEIYRVAEDILNYETNFSHIPLFFLLDLRSSNMYPAKYHEH